MKTMIKTTLFLMLMTIGINVMAQKTDFSGIWKIQADKVDWGQAPQTVLPSAYSIQQGAKTFTMTRTLIDEAQVEHFSGDTLTYDNKPITNSHYSGNKKTTSIKWSDDHQHLLLATKLSSTSGEMIYTAEETWTLSEGGKTLTIERAVEQDNGGKYTIKGIYQKQ